MEEEGGGEEEEVLSAMVKFRKNLSLSLSSEETARLFVRVLRVCVTMIKTSGFFLLFRRTIFSFFISPSSSSSFFFQDERIIEREEKLDERPGREVDIKGVRRETGNGERERTAVMEWRKTGRRRRKAGQESERKGEKERWKEWKESKEK